jgi:drug/metabolite transporter (DMT)-like permease
VPGEVVVLLSALGFATGGVIARTLFDQGISPFTVAALRVTGAGLVMAVVLATLRPQLLRIPRRHWLRVAAFGVLAIAGTNVLTYLAIARLPVGEAITLQYLGIVLVVFAQAAHSRRAPSRRLVAALAFSLPGTALLAGVYHPARLSADRWGVAFALTAAVFFAGFLLSGRALQRDVPSLTLQTWAFLIAAVGWGMLFAIHPQWFQFPVVGASSLGRVGLVILLANLLGYVGLLMGLRRIGASRTGVLMTSETVFSTAIGFVWLGQRLELWQLIGGAMVVAAVILARLAEAELGSSPPAELPTMPG